MIQDSQPVNTITNVVEQPVKDEMEDITPIDTKRSNSTNQRRSLILAESSQSVPTSVNTISSEAAQSEADAKISKEVLSKKANDCQLLFILAQSYSYDISQVIKIINESLLKKIQNTYNQGKNFMMFFKELQATFMKFSKRLLRTNNILANVPGQIISNEASMVIEKTQETIIGNLDKYCSALQTNMISQGTFTKLEGYTQKFNAQTKLLREMLERLEYQRDEFQKLYNTQFAKRLEYYQKGADPQAPNSVETELYLVEKDMLLSTNEIFRSTETLLKGYKEKLTNMQVLIFEYLNIIRETIEIYMNENKKMFIINSIENYVIFQNYCKAIANESTEVGFKIPNVFAGEEKAVEDLNKIVQQFQIDLLSSNLYEENTTLKNTDAFKIQTYNTLEEFIDMFIDLNPKPVTSNNELIIFKADLKRDPGFMKNWKNCQLIITLQNNFLIVDDQIVVEIFDIKNTKIRPIEDKKNHFLFEISKTKKGVIFNSTVDLLLDGMNKANYDAILQVLYKISNSKAKFTRKLTI